MSLDFLMKSGRDCCLKRGDKSELREKNELTENLISDTVVRENSFDFNEEEWK